MAEVRETQEPIGYWLKHTDELITTRSDQALSSEGFTRTRWQTLHLIYTAGTTSRANVLATMRTFITAGQLDDILVAFVQQGWLTERSAGEESALQLTEAGRQVHERVFARQRDVRLRAMQGVSREEYSNVISILRRIAHNLEDSQDER
jgi:DNA-binding MarR family transcriptional regulator